MPIFNGQDYRELFDGYKIDKDSNVYGIKGWLIKPWKNGKYVFERKTQNGSWTTTLSIAEIESMKSNLFTS